MIRKHKIEKAREQFSTFQPVNNAIGFYTDGVLYSTEKIIREMSSAETMIANCWREAAEKVYYRRVKSRLLILVFTLVFTVGATQKPIDLDVARWKREARNITITRDDWGIAHVRGKTDADAVFGMIYAQAEDDFNRIETNYQNSMGRLAESEGEGAIWSDLRMKLFIDPDRMKEYYAASPLWLKTLMNSWSDGLNYYLHTHPEVKPHAITRFEPWMALTFSEGSIGGDIERVDLGALEAFYGGIVGKPSANINDQHNEYTEPTGSNGIAIAPSNTLNHHSLLLINPHTSFFFRSELQMTSDEGLNAYGAVTWGQFFVYQGFNPRLGWMHTSSGVDAVDEYLETVTEKDGRFFYKYGNEERPMATRKIIVPYKTANGMARREFTVFRSEHGPVIRQENGKWVAIHLMQEPLKALMQSYSRTKAHDYQSYRKAMELHANSSNNTIYADADGNIAYFHANYIPKRNSRFDWTKPVDGSDPETDWGAMMTLDETPHLLNPPSGWIYNCNDWPWSAAGLGSLRREDFPPYVETGREESPRGIHAIGLLQNKKDYTIESLNAAAYDTYLPAFARMIPALLHAYDRPTNTDESKTNLSEQIKLLRSWDYRWSVDSVPTTLAVFWGEAVGRRLSAEAGRAEMSPELYVATKASPEPLLQALAEASEKLASDFGTWRMRWGDINRFQRLSDDIVHPFNDAALSIPVGFTSARWGSLASFGAHAYPGTKKWYGTSGNSFVAIVEFGEKVRAKAVTAGGESGDFRSRHFNDEAERYSRGALRDVYFYRSQLNRHTERTYKPGKL